MPFCDVVASEFYIDSDAIMQAVQRSASFNAVHFDPCAFIADAFYSGILSPGSASYAHSYLPIAANDAIHRRPEPDTLSSYRLIGESGFNPGRENCSIA